MRFGVKALSRGLHKIGSKVSKPLNKLGSKHTLKTIGNIAHKAGEIGAVVSTVAPEVGMPLMALSAADGTKRRCSERKSGRSQRDWSVTEYPRRLEVLHSSNQ